MNTDKELVRIVTSFRKGVLGGKKPLKMCKVICEPLSSFLAGCGYPNELTEGEVHLAGHNEGITIGHYWLTLPNGRIIDPTASQFNTWGREGMPKVYFGEKPEWYVKLTGERLDEIIDDAISEMSEKYKKFTKKNPPPAQQQ